MPFSSARKVQEEITMLHFLKTFLFKRKDFAKALYYLFLYFLFLTIFVHFRFNKSSGFRRPKTKIRSNSESVHRRVYFLLKNNELSTKLAHLRIPSLPSSHPCHSFPFPKKIRFWPCRVCYLPLKQAVLSEPNLTTEPNLILINLTYANAMSASEKRAKRLGFPPRFGGYPSMRDRMINFHVKPSMRVHCGFVWSRNAGEDGGFEISRKDRMSMKRENDIIVVSAIFGAYDMIKPPGNLSSYSKKNIPFYMFVDDATYEDACTYDHACMRTRTRTNRTILTRFGGWKIVLVTNMPFNNTRRNGRIPKLLLHRLFPNVKHSIWIDGKLKLTVDPYMVLERFLWRYGSTLAISNHFRNYDIFKEAMAIKKLGRYDNKSIDDQIKVYKKDGMKVFSKRKWPIISDVPESCVLIRTHTPLTNLFSCLWFGELDRYTPRDQISFGYVRDRVLKQVKWKMSMFLDCERRNFTLLVDHIPDLLKKEALFNASMDETSNFRSFKFLEEINKINV